jgi:hypothetical protein
MSLSMKRHAPAVTAKVRTVHQGRPASDRVLATDTESSLTA